MPTQKAHAEPGLVTIDQIEKTITEEFRLHDDAAPITVELRSSIVTAAFIEQMSEVASAGEEARVARAVAGGNRHTRRAAKAAKVQTEGAPSTLEAQRGQMIFMARTLERVVVRWNMGARNPATGEVEPVTPTADYFRENFSYELLTRFFEWAVFEAAAPKKQTTGPSERPARH